MRTCGLFCVLLSGAVCLENVSNKTAIFVFFIFDSLE